MNCQPIIRIKFGRNFSNMKALNKVVNTYKNSGFEGTDLPEALMELREVYKAAEDPTLTKVCRLAAEHITENQGFLVDVFEEDREEGDETSFEYFLSLLHDPNNKFNREEIKEYRTLLWDDLGY